MQVSARVSNEVKEQLWGRKRSLQGSEEGQFHDVAGFPAQLHTELVV